MQGATLGSSRKPFRAANNSLELQIASLDVSVDSARKATHRASTFSTTFSSLKTSMTSQAAAQATALPAYVPPYMLVNALYWHTTEERTIDPAFSLSVISFRLMTPLRGKPLARPYANRSAS